MYLQNNLHATTKKHSPQGVNRLQYLCPYCISEEKG